MLHLAHSLAASELGATIPGRDAMVLVLAALAHANGSHEHSGAPTPDPSGGLVDQSSGRQLSLTRLGSLHPWPDLPRC